MDGPLSLWLIEPLGPVPAGAALGFLLALLISAPGFHRVVYFISTGYAFSVAAMAVMSFWLHREGLRWWSVAQLLLLLAYGLRLGLFLVGRERFPSYKKELAEVQKRAVGITRPIQVAIWLTVSGLYVAQFFPAWIILSRNAGPDAAPGFAPVGVAIMALGLAIEALADRQKSAFKARNPGRFCDEGLYRLVRCPNYFGEMVFWTGMVLSAVLHLTHWSHWIVSVAGWVCIELIMVGSTRRLELKQDERYGERDDYQGYVERTPVLIPLVPLYSVKNAPLYLG